MSKEETCEITCIDKEKVISLKKRMIPEKALERLSETFKALGDITRTKIIYALSLEELCVCDIANIIGTSKYAVSHQLRILRNMKLVKHRKEGKMVFYSLDDEHIKNLFNECLRHVKEQGL